MRFQCQPGCIRCCEQTGHVYLNRDDIARLAAHLQLSRAEFRRRYLCGPPSLPRFRKPRGRQCPFLLADGCSVHAVKPLQCSSFPFWPELIASATERQQAAAYCPGMNRGALVNLTLAKRTASQVQRAFPLLYPQDSTAD
jgi:Fe-S-cluster containining protein